MQQRTLNNQDGIALGQILFIIVILAIIAAAIAAGSGSFNANMGTENAKAMAEVIIQTCDDYQRAVQMMTMRNGCDITAIDWTPSGWPPGFSSPPNADFTNGNGTNRTGNGQCALYDPRGGGMLFKPLPSSAKISNSSNLYTYSGVTQSNYDAFAGYPELSGSAHMVAYGNHQINDVILTYNYIDNKVCTQVNNILKVSYSSVIAFSWSNIDQNSIYLRGWNVGSEDNNNPGLLEIVGSSTAIPFQGCNTDYYGNGANTYYCALMIR
jgi:hypothetical protein